jgi:hypothetical protein
MRLPHTWPPISRRRDAFAVTAAFGAAVRFAFGPDIVKPDLFIPDIVATALLCGGTTALLWGWARPGAASGQGPGDPRRGTGTD